MGALHLYFVQSDSMDELSCSEAFLSFTPSNSALEKNTDDA